jgi:hypothetical protein
MEEHKFYSSKSSFTPNSLIYRVSLFNTRVLFYSATHEFFVSACCFPRQAVTFCLFALFENEKRKTGIKSEHVFSTEVMHIICMYRGRRSYSRQQVRHRARLAHAGPQERY